MKCVLYYACIPYMVHDALQVYAICPIISAIQMSGLFFNKVLYTIKMQTFLPI